MADPVVYIPDAHDGEHVVLVAVPIDDELIFDPRHHRRVVAQVAAHVSDLLAGLTVGEADPTSGRDEPDARSTAAWGRPGTSADTSVPGDSGAGCVRHALDTPAVLTTAESRTRIDRCRLSHRRSGFGCVLTSRPIRTTDRSST